MHYVRDIKSPLDRGISSTGRMLAVSSASATRFSRDKGLALHLPDLLPRRKTIIPNQLITRTTGFLNLTLSMAKK